MIYPEKAEVHILEDETVSREYLLQVWAEAMTIYHSGEYSMKFPKVDSEAAGGGSEGLHAGGLLRPGRFRASWNITPAM